MVAQTVQSPWRGASACSRFAWSVWFCLWLAPLVLLITVRSAVADEAGEIVSVLGTTEVSRGGHWQPVSAGDRIAAGEVLRTGAGSRLAIQLANSSHLKLNANSQLELKQITPRLEGFVPTTTRLLQNLLRIFSGEIWIRSIGEPLQIQTPAATATIRGTEFNLAVSPDDSARLAVLTGTVEFSNPQGHVLVEKGEQATARPGEAPRKTVLINPLDAVQWSLYYPGIVSYRDYPLTTIAPSQRPSQFALATQRVAASPRDVNAWIALGELSLDLGKRAEARQAFTQALRLDPVNARARTGLGWVYLAAGELKAALLEFQQPQPPTLMTLVGMANVLYRLNRLDESNRTLLEAERRFPTSPIPWTQAALNALIQGHVTEARQALDRALKLDPHDAPAYALRSNIELVQNQRARALEAAQQAVAANPESPSAWLSLSLVKQAEFQLDDALQAAHKAVELDPANSQTLIQESRLRFGRGQIEQAFKLAEKARRKGPPDALVDSTWGFLQLARFHVDQAMAAFQTSIAEDSTRGEPHLGLGIALFRHNKTRKAVEEIEKATLLEPQVSLYQSYLGKAYYEIKQDQLAQKHLALAKQLDPRDPTPYFYDAILQQSVNRPIKAVRDLQKSIELNDDRAVYRSRLLLDEDLAARSATLGQIYNEIGFGQLGLSEGRKSLTNDPANYSAHRLLADSYSALPRHEIARVSELLQSQLLQPINITPIPPHLTEAKLLLPNAGPITPSLYEFNPLFVRDRPTLFTSGIVGSNSTLSDEVILSGIEAGRFSYSLGQFHYNTNGFWKNNDLTHDIYNLFAQAEVTPEINLQSEYRYRKTEFGNLSQGYNQNLDTPDRTDVNQKTARLGGRYSPVPSLDFIASLIYTDRKESQHYPTVDDVSQNFLAEEKGYQTEAQFLYKANYFNLITGLGTYTTDVHIGNQFTRNQKIIYNYANIKLPENLIWTAGLSYQFYHEPYLDLNKLNPKLGIQWDVTDNLSLRAAVFKTIEPVIAVNQTIEPTQIAGFNQFTDVINGTESKRYGMGLDARLISNLFGGLEVSRRELKIPITPGAELSEIENDREDLYGGYLYWLPYQNWSVTTEYFYESFKIINGQIRRDYLAIPTRIETVSIPLTIHYFEPLGFFIETGAVNVWQHVKFNSSYSEQFFLVDVTLGYRFPNRWGVISIGVNNLFDRKFKFQDDSFQASDATVNPRFFPGRAITAQIILNP